jgi:hypothetical protein
MRALGVLISVLSVSAAFGGDAAPVPPANPRPAPPDPMQKAVAEFRLQSERLGLRPGTSPSHRVKSGPAAKFHGRLSENFRNDFLDAVPHEIRQRGQNKSLLRRNQFGFNVGGPVVIPRLFSGARTTFFSVSFEGVRERISRSSLHTIPALLERSGDFSQTVDLAGNPLPIFDPATTRANPNFNPAEPVSEENLKYVRDPFPGNRIPVNRLDPTAREALTLYPEPNTSAGPFLQNNYFSVSPETNTANGMIFKLDHMLREKHRFDFSTAFSNGLAGSARLFPTAADPNPPDRKYSSRSGTLRHTWTVSPRMVNTLAFGASTRGVHNQGDSIPIYRFSPYTRMGRENSRSRSVRNDFWIENQFSRRVGSHSLKFSGGWERQQVNALSDAAPDGAFTFGSGLTSLPGIVNTGHSFASFLLGMPEQVERSATTAPSYFSRELLNAKASDRWEVRRGLTLSGSLNFEINRPRVEKYDRQSTVDLSLINPANNLPGAMIVAGQNGIGRGLQPVRYNFEPSFGIAWSPLGSTRTVIRTSWARSTSGIGLTSGQFGTQAFNAYSVQISKNAQLEPVVLVHDGLPPAPSLPDLRPDAVNNMVADLIDRSGRQPRTEAVNFSVEREMPGSILFTAGYYHHDGDNMLVSNAGVNVNGIPLDSLRFRDALNDESFRSSLRPYPQYISFEVNSQYPVGRYVRDAGFFRLEKRTSGGLGLSAYYELGKQLDDYSGPWGVQDPYNRDNEWARTAGVNPSRLTLTYVYELPIGPSKALLAWTDWRRYFVEGWSLSGMTSIYSGDPLYLRPQFNNTGGVVDSLRVNVVPGVDPSVPNQGPDLWFNPSAFAQPADFTIGNGPRTHPFLSQPGSQNNDLSVTKRFTLDAERAVELSAVGFNVINHANWNDPDTVIGSASSPNVNAGRIIGSRGSRVVQLGIRYSF